MGSLGLTVVLNSESKTHRSEDVIEADTNGVEFEEVGKGHHGGQFVQIPD